MRFLSCIGCFRSLGTPASEVHRTPSNSVCFPTRIPAGMTSTANLPTADACKAGCLMGALIGDALGAPLEFLHAITEARLQSALSMHGGGVWNVGPGQITDDGELALCLAQALAGHGSWTGSFPADEVAAVYAAWYKSQPFDIGNTCQAAFYTDEQGAAGMRARASAASMGSKANGALMRAAPIPLWLPADASPESVVDCAQQDAQLSHPNKTCLDANAAYCLALWHLVNHPGDNQGALAAALAWAKKHATPEVLQWLQVDSKSIEHIVVREMQGFVKWAFVLAFACLRQGQQCSFEEGITRVLRLGGDTDTNACIVGAMLGALHGVHAIPQQWVKAVLGYQYEATQTGHARPGFLTPGHILPRLIAHWPWLKEAGVLAPTD